MFTRFDFPESLDKHPNKRIINAVPCGKATMQIGDNHAIIAINIFVNYNRIVHCLLIALALDEVQSLVQIFLGA